MTVTGDRKFSIGSLSDATQMYRLGLLNDFMDREKLDELAFMSDGLIKFASNWSLDGRRG